MKTYEGCFRLNDRVTLLPVVHASGAYARAVERWLLEHPIDCIAVPLPPSFGEPVCQAVQKLPIPSIVMQPPAENSAYEFDLDLPDEDDLDLPGEVDYDWPASHSYVPVDPSQSVITAIRFALGEHLPIRFVDLEVAEFQEVTHTLPDAFALRNVAIETFAAAALPAIERPAIEQTRQRIEYMAAQLRKLAPNFRNIVMLCSIEHWPWLREAYFRGSSPEPHDELDSSAPLEIHEAVPYSVAENTLIFLMGELPYITGAYEQARQNSTGDQQSVLIDGVKQLLMSARASYMADLGVRGRRITPLLLSQCLKYMRNLTLLDRRLSPDLYTIAVASKQILGDQFAIHVVEAARNYLYSDYLPWPTVTLGMHEARLPDGEQVPIINRLAGSPQEWRTIELNRKPLRDDSKKWQMRWNPYRQCSWPPEDDLIESFRARVIERARAAMGADLARTEKFSTSLLDGIDIRETLRHWYDGNLYVKIQPPSVGHLDACLLLFEHEADPRAYPWRTTWFAEHEDESTLAFFATDYRQEMLGPGVAVATYGGALFLYPPRSIPDVWKNPELDFAETLEDRLVGAACLHAKSKQIAFLSPTAPGAERRRLAKRFGKTLVHVPLSQFNDGVVQQLRTVHVLNGQHIRSYASHFIRQA
ncbi:MAG: hypothetical protein SGI77_17800 [Pirellulaceae bacterium]|nr:hypothetical protein [Pirellulaceae bacterium]